MGKLDQIHKRLGANIDESMGAGASAAPSAAPAPRTLPPRWQGVRRSTNVADIPVNRIEPDPTQPREEFDDESLDHLAQSLKTRGQLQPIRVRWNDARESYIIICGERRWRAAARAGLETVSCVVVEGELSATELLTLQLIENLVREDLKPIEQALAFRSLIDAQGWSAQDLADELRVSKPTVIRALALLNLPANVQDQVEQGALSPATAYEVSKLDDQTDRAQVAELAVSGQLTRAEVIREVRRRQQSPSKTRPRTTRIDITIPDGKVAVTLNIPEADTPRVLAALRAAIKSVKDHGLASEAELHDEAA